MKKMMLLMMCVMLFACGESEQDDENMEDMEYENTQSDMSSDDMGNNSANSSSKENMSSNSDNKENKTPFRNEEIAGEWTVRMRVTNTSCEGVNVGDVKEERWFVNFETGELNIQIMDKGNPNKEYWGKFSGLNIEAVADKMLSEQEPFSAEETSKPINRIRLKVGDRNNIMGTRTDNSKNSCQTIYEVEMKR